MTSDPAATLRPRPPRPGWRSLHTLVASVAVLGLVADQATKGLAVNALSDGSVVHVVDDILSLRLLRNSGAAFSVGEGTTWLFTVAAVVVVVVILRASRRLGSRAWAMTLGLLLAGAAGNLTDRLVRQPGPGRGHVVDFIDYNGWFVGNVADIFIVSAAAAVALLGLRGISVDGSRHDDPGKDSGKDSGKAPSKEPSKNPSEAPGHDTKEEFSRPERSGNTDV